MKILITGAGGMLGTDLAECFSDFAQVTGLGLWEAPHLKIPYGRCDLRQAGALDRIVDEGKPDFVFHAAAMTHVDACESEPLEAHSKNVMATERVIRACKAVKAFLIFFSTDYVFDGEKQGEYKEDDPVNPLNIYGRTKLEAERLIQSSADHFTIFRLSWLFGGHGRSFPRTILELLKERNELKVVDDQKGRPTYTRDIAEAFKRLFERDPNALRGNNREIFHLANEGCVSWADFAMFLSREAGKEGVRLERITSRELNRPARRPANSVLDLEKIHSRLGMRLRPWQEAARDFVKRLNKKQRDLDHAER